MKRTLSSRTGILSLFAAVVCFLCAPSLHAQWTYTWGDDFNGAANTTYDHTLWTNEVKENTGNVWGDSTVQSTSDSLSNVYLDGNGDLIIAMTYNANPPSGQTDYESARLKSLPTTGVGPYGQFDFIAQNPSAAGMGAAIWSMGASNNTGTPWPWCGELDMMELQSKNNQHNGSTVHGGQTDGQTYYEYGGLSSAVNLSGSTNFDNSFHQFTTNWAPYHLQFLLDGAIYADIHQYNLGITDQWSTNKPYQLLLTSGIGGNGGTPGTTGFPSNLTIQYVHYNTWSAGAPAPVTNLAVTGTSSNSVSLSWTASTTAGVVYDIYASPTQGAALSDTTEVIEGISGTTYTDTGLLPNTTLYYTVVAANFGGESAQANVTATTLAPGNSTAIQMSAGGYAFGTYTASKFVLGGATNFHWQPGPPAQLTPVDVSGVTNPAPQEVYNIERWGAATWAIQGLSPLAGYNVRLHFVEFSATNDVKGARDFNVFVNNQLVLPDFDIYSAAGAINKAVTEQFYTQADENGIISIQTTKGTSTTALDLNPTINAIEILPATGSNPVGSAPGTTTDLAINSGGPVEGNFVADEDFNGGDTSTTTTAVTTTGIANAAPEAVYQSERYVPFTYVLSGLVADATYQVNMHFAETYWTAAGKRIFNVNLNGTRVLSNFDVYATAGGDTALVESFSTQADKYGLIYVQFFDGSEDNPFINGIEAIETAGPPKNVAPAITTQPVAQTVTAGQTATFSVVATGTPAPTYQWYENGAAISGATAASYTTPATTTANSGETFYVVVTNSVGSVTSSTVALTVNPANVAPAITTQPVSQTVTAGQTATFSVVATGYPAPTYQWYMNSAAISGATAASYTTPATTTANSGETFYVVVTNSVGSVTSSTVTLTVNAAPAITTQPVSQTVTAGATATFSVTATGTPAPTYQWYMNSAAISGATASSYTTPATTTANSGETFYVVVTNSVGSVTSSTVTLTVNAATVKPTITTQPASQTVTAGATATFSVVATGTPAPTYQWYENSAAISGATAASYTTPATTTANSGETFYVIVTNSAGSVTSSTVTLTVNAATVKPTITTQPASQTVTAGATATFTVVATGTPTPTYQWYMNSAAISGATAASYTTPATTTANSGETFYVIVTNSAGSVTSSTVTLTVNPATSGPDFIAIACGGPAESNATGGDASFVADVDFSGGGDNTHTTKTINLTQPGVNAAPMAVYQYGRAGTMTYTIPGMVAGSSHSVLLHFSENYYSAKGKREFNVAINGTPVLTNFDIYATAGAEYTAVVETFTATANSSGQIVIAFTKGADNQALIDGIEIR